jgi:hypothetical protein
MWRETRQENRRVEALEGLYLEPGLLDSRNGISIGVAAAEEPPPEGLQAILPAGRRPRGADVFDKQQPSAWAKDAPNLVQR